MEDDSEQGEKLICDGQSAEKLLGAEIALSSDACVGVGRNDKKAVGRIYFKPFIDGSRTNFTSPIRSFLTFVRMKECFGAGESGEARPDGHQGQELSGSDGHPQKSTKKEKCRKFFCTKRAPSNLSFPSAIDSRFVLVR